MPRRGQDDLRRCINLAAVDLRLVYGLTSLTSAHLARMSWYEPLPAGCNFGPWAAQIVTARSVRAGPRSELLFAGGVPAIPFETVPVLFTGWDHFVRLCNELVGCGEPRKATHSRERDRVESGELRADGSNVVISLRTKYSIAERKYSVPVECLQDLIVDLQRLSLSGPTAAFEKADSQTEPPLPLELPVAAE